MIKKIIINTFLLILIFVFTACGPTVVPPGEDSVIIDPMKTQIYVQVVNGGYGTQWALTAAKDFNAIPENNQYQVVITGSSDEDSLTNIKTNIQAGVGVRDAYFTSEPNIKPMINAGLLEDLSDIYQTKILGEDVTIKQKLKYSDNVEVSFSNYGEGIYGLPYGDGFSGFIFDHDLFMEKGWLMVDYDNPTELSAGPDGKKGTYDDGQPISIEEWEIMLDLISSESYSYPFIYTTQYPSYLTTIVDAILAQYSGLDAYKTFLTYDGDIVDTNGNTITVTPETGYKVYEMDGLDKAVRFLDKYLTNDSRYINPVSWKTVSTSHRDAQDRFVVGYTQSASSPLGAMLVEGNWWEREATPIFNSLEDRGNPDRGYGQRDYRYMMYPKMEGQKGIDGNGNGSVINCMDAGAVFVPKNDKDPEKLQKTKEFISYTLKDEYLQLFTTICGAVRPYNYTLSDEQFNGLTPFQKNVWEIYNDTDNVAIIRANFDSNASPFYYNSSKPSRYYTNIEGAAYSTIFKSLERYTADEALSSMKNYNAANWSKYYSEVSKYL